MFCKYCGRQIADDSKFCEFCGELVQRKTTEEIDPIIPPAADIGAPILKEDYTEQIPPVMEEEPVSTEEPTRVVPTVKERPPVSEIEQEDEEEEVAKPPINKGLLWGLIGGGVGLLALVILILALALRTPVTKVDVSQYVDFKVSGYDGFGVATCSLDEDGLERAALGEYPVGTDGKTREKQIEYKEKAATLKGAVTIEFIKREKLKVGDKLEAKIKVDRSVEKKLHIEFSTNLTVSYTVTDKDLSGSTALDVLSEFYEIGFEGLSGKATALLKVKERKEEFYFTLHDGTEYTVEPTVENSTGLPVLKLLRDDGSVEAVTMNGAFSLSEQIKNGDTVTYKLAEDVGAKLMDYGLSLSASEMTVQVAGLEELITDIAKLDTMTLNTWVSDYGTALNKYIIANWNELVHGGNILASATVSADDLTCVKQVLASSDNSNALFLMFSADLSDEAILMDNYGLPKTHYFAVRIENLLLDGEGKLMTEKLRLPTEKGEGYFGAFVQYDELKAKTVDTFEKVSEK